FAWDNNGRKKIYEFIGRSIVEMGYSKIISGGIDTDAKEIGGSIYHFESAITTAALYICYSVLKLNRCIVEKFDANNLHGFTLASNELTRKSFLINAANVVIALPGAIGTFSEILAAIVAGKNIILCNIYIKERHCYYFQSL